MRKFTHPESSDIGAHDSVARRVGYAIFMFVCCDLIFFAFCQPLRGDSWEPYEDEFYHVTFTDEVGSTVKGRFQGRVEWKRLDNGDVDVFEWDSEATFKLVNDGGEFYVSNGQVKEAIIDLMPDFSGRLRGVVVQERRSLVEMLDPLQGQTLAAIRDLSTSFMSWFTDRISNFEPGDPLSGAHASEKIVWIINSEKRVLTYQHFLISHETLTSILVPKYTAAVPMSDAWGHPYEFFYNGEFLVNYSDKHAFCIRSPGRDGFFGGERYTVGEFPHEELDQDIVTCSGYPVRWPSRPGPP